MKKADPGATSSKTTQRVQFELPPSTYERLCSLKDKTEAASYTEVIKNALKLYESLPKNTVKPRPSGRGYKAKLSQHSMC